MKTIDRNRIEAASRILFYCLFGYGYFYCFIPTTFLQLGDLTLVVTLLFSVVTAVALLYAAATVALSFRSAYLQKDRSQLPLLILQALLVVVSYMFWIRKGCTDKIAGIMLMVLLGVSAKGKNSSTILRIALIIGTAFTVLCFVLSMTGIIDNNRGNSYGFIYRTDYACHLLFLMLIYCFYYSGSLPWQGELGILALNLYNFFFVGGKTADICMPLVLFATYLRHYQADGCVPFQDRSPFVALFFRVLYLPFVIADQFLWRIKSSDGNPGNNPFSKPISKPISMSVSNSVSKSGSKSVSKPVIDPSGGAVTVTAEPDQNLVKRHGLRAFIVSTFRRCCALSFAIFAALMVGVTALYHFIPVKWFEAVPKLRTVRARLLLGIVGFDIYPVNLFGNSVISRGAGGTENGIDFYYFLDCSYIKMLLEDGLVIFVVVLLLMTFLQLRLYRKSYFYECFLLAVAALDCTMEHHLTDLSYNMFGVLLLSTLERPVPAPPVFGIRFKPAPAGSAKARFRRIYATVSVLLMIAAFPTAHAVTNWSGYAPASRAVVLLPGSYMEGYTSSALQDARIETAVRYLSSSSHENAVCITSGAEAEELHRLLKEQGISEDRIYTDPASESLEDALLYADNLIEKEHLTNRKTVCTFELEQARVKETAHDLGTPVNGLSIPLKGLDYARCFVNEQFQLLSHWIRRCLP